MEVAQDRPDWTREVAALRRVARALLADEHATDDVLQEAWLRAHARREAPERPEAYWKRVVANLARDRRRGESRRAQREAQVARAEALPCTDDVAERLELVQRVARAAAELPEPYRSTIHLHYFEDRSAQQIATLAGVPLETVRTRIRRGLERMRASLDESAGGDRAAWSLALAPLALQGAHEPTLTASAALVTTAAGLLAVNKLVLAAAAGLIAVGALWFAMRNDPDAAPLAASAPTIEALAGLLDVSPAPTDETRPPESAENARTALDVEAATPAADDGLVEVTGTFTLIEDSGRRRTDLDGLLWVQFRSADGRAEDNLFEVLTGRWSARVPSTVHLHLGGVFAEGQPARLIGDRTIVPSAEPVELEAVPWPRTTLRVVDASTGLDLDDVELRWSTINQMTMAERHPGDPGPMDVQRQGLSSPFEVEWLGMIDESISVRLWVHVPGMAWNWCDVLPQAGGQRTVELTPGGDLEVYPTGPRPEVSWRIYLVELEGGQPESRKVVAWQTPAEGEVTRFDGLAPGTYRVGAVSLVLATDHEGTSETFEVKAGETTRVSLSLEEFQAARARTHLTGTLRWSEGTPLNDLRIDPIDARDLQEMLFLSLDRMTPDPEQPRTLHWDAGEVIRGEYLALDFASGLRHRFSTGEGPTFRLDLELAPRAQIVVRAFDARDGSSIPNAQAAWSVVDEKGGPLESWLERKDEFGQGFVRLDVPAQEVVLSITAPGRTTHRETLRMDPGEVRELEVQLARETGLEVRLVEGEALVPMLYVRPQLVDPAGERVRAQDWSWNSSTCRILLEPGAYRLTFEQPEAGWLAPGWIDVRVLEGVLTPVDFPLERAP